MPVQAEPPTKPLPMSASPDPQSLPNASPPADALRLVLETALDAVIVMRDDGVVADWNHHAVTIFRLDARRGGRARDGGSDHSRALSCRA